MVKESPTVFISYAHDSPEHKQIVLDFADKLNSDGIDCWCDRYIEGSSPERGWPAWMEEKVRLSKYVLVVCSEKYLKRFNDLEDAGIGLGGKFESIIIVQEIFDNDSKNSKFIPILLKKDDKKYIIAPLKPWTYYDISSDEDYETLYRRLTNQIKILKPSVGSLKRFEDNGVKSIVSDTFDASGEDLFASKIPEIPQFTDNMKPGMKILQAYFLLPITKRFSIAVDLELLREGESFENSNAEKLSGEFLVRAKEQNLLGELWSKLFDENIDPNPFKI